MENLEVAEPKVEVAEPTPPRVEPTVSEVEKTPEFRHALDKALGKGLESTNRQLSVQRAVADSAKAEVDAAKASVSAIETELKDLHRQHDDLVTKQFADDPEARQAYVDKRAIAEEKKELAKERFQVKKEAETAALDASSAILQRRALELSRETGIDVKELDNLDEVSMVEKALRFQLTKEPEEVKEFDSGESTGGTQVFSRRRIAEMPIEEYAKFKPEIEKALREGRVKE